jgi:ankyrin repeat protein
MSREVSGEIKLYFDFLCQYRERDVNRALAENPEFAATSHYLTGELPIIIAANHGFIRLFPALERHGADINSKDEYGNSVLTLLLKGKSPGFWDPQYAPAEDCSIFMEVVKKANLDCDEKGLSPLHLAALGRHVLPIDALCQRNPAQINDKDKSGRTPLHCACVLNGWDELVYVSQIVKKLLENGADENILDNNGEPPKNYLLRGVVGGDDSVEISEEDEGV